jgi:hypothetical protein
MNIIFLVPEKMVFQYSLKQQDSDLICASLFHLILKTDARATREQETEESGWHH